MLLPELPKPSLSSGIARGEYKGKEKGKSTMHASNTVTLVLLLFSALAVNALPMERSLPGNPFEWDSIVTGQQRAQHKANELTEQLGFAEYMANTAAKNGSEDAEALEENRINAVRKLHMQEERILQGKTTVGASVTKRKDSKKKAERGKTTCFNCF